METAQSITTLLLMHAFSAKKSPVPVRRKAALPAAGQEAYSTANILMPQIRKPVASSNRPPTALKSAIIAGVVRGKISAAQVASVSWIASIGMQMADTAIPSEQAKMMAVKKSKNDLAIKIFGSPVILPGDRTEDPGTAGAKQHDDSHIALNKGFVRNVGVRAVKSCCAFWLPESIDPFFEMTKLAN